MEPNNDWRTDEQRFGWKTYAQHGDDLMLVNLFDMMGIEKPSYLDLGANHPVTISNTHLLYERGSRGVNVEANPSLMGLFTKYRPEDINVNVGVGVKLGRQPFYMVGETSGLNSFSKEEVESTGQKITKVVDIEVIGVNDIVRKHCGGQFPSLLLTDIEGLDYEVLRSADFTSSKPKVICTEIRSHQSNQVKDYLSTHGYMPYCRCQANLIFVLRAYAHKVY